MVKYFAIIVLIAFLGLEASAAAAEMEEETFANIYSCISNDLSKFQSDVIHALKTNPADAVCGPNTLNDLSNNIVKIVKQAQQCKDLSCYVSLLPLFKEELYSVGAECTNKVKEGGPYILSHRAYDTIHECIVKPLA